MVVWFTVHVQYAMIQGRAAIVNAFAENTRVTTATLSAENTMIDEGAIAHYALREGVIMVNKLDDRTCATCLSRLNDVYTRKKNEKAVHDRVKPEKFCCRKCGKAYMKTST